MSGRDRESKLITELRKKNRKLSIENQKLRKQLRLIEEQSVDQFEDDTPPLPTTIKGEGGVNCRKCGAYVDNVFDLVGKRYYLCSCGSKGPVGV